MEHSSAPEDSHVMNPLSFFFFFSATRPPSTFARDAYIRSLYALPLCSRIPLITRLSLAHSLTESFDQVGGNVALATTIHTQDTLVFLLGEDNWSARS